MSDDSEESEENKPAPLEYDEQYFNGGGTFLSVAGRYISRGRPEHQWREVQHLQMRLAEAIVDSADSPDWVKLLRAMVAPFDDERGFEEQRYHALRSIRDCGAKWKLDEWRASDENAAHLFEQFGHIAVV